jgi:hypothetical protein
MARNWKWYVENDDFEGALDRFNNAYKNWKDHWFEVCQTIFENSSEWAKKYILNPIEKTISKISNFKRIYKDGKACAYVVKVWDYAEECFWLKIGKANDLEKRYKNDKKYALVEVYNVYNFESGDVAQSMENILRTFFKKEFPQSHKPLDRFEEKCIANITEEMWKILEKKAEEIKKVFIFA